MMISAWLFLAGMYLHLILSVAVPASILLAGKYEFMGHGFIDALLAFYFFVIAAVHVTGWICVAAAVSAGRKGQLQLLCRGWRLLKLGAIPFFVLNFLYSFLVWFLFVAASRGIFALLLPIPIGITCLLIFQTGGVGICCLRLLRRQPVPVPGKVHYLLQLIPVVDVVSTVVVLAGERKKGEGF